MCVFTDNLLPLFPLETCEKIYTTNQDLFKHEKLKKEVDETNSTETETEMNEVDVKSV